MCVYHKAWSKYTSKRYPVASLVNDISTVAWVGPVICSAPTDQLILVVATGNVPVKSEKEVAPATLRKPKLSEAVGPIKPPIQVPRFPSAPTVSLSKAIVSIS